MTTTTFATQRPASKSQFGKFDLLSTIKIALAARRQRQALAKLDDAALLDLGLTHSEVETETSRPLWDVPANWRQ